MTSALDAVVVGSGPNGLAAAITLARAGRSVQLFEAAPTVGGGLRTAELAPGVPYDVCSAVHPLGVGSPFFRQLPLEEFGLTWMHPEIPFTQPLDDGRAGVAFRSLDDTVANLGADGKRYRRLIGPAVKRWWDLADDALGPLIRLPSHPLVLARFGLPGLLPSSVLAKGFSTEEGKALLAGTAGHSIIELNRPFTGSVAMMFSASAHAVGWPVVKGGSQQLANALAQYFESLGGTIIVNHPVETMKDLPDHRAALFDVAPVNLLQIAGDRLGGRYRRRLHKWKHGPGLFKVDYVVSEPVPWTDPWSSRAGTVHVGGTFAEVAHAESEVANGRHAERPFVLVAQPAVADPARFAGKQHALWAYAHVPAGSTLDQTAAIDAQIERFAPGFRDTIVSRHTINTVELEQYNANNVGGDISGGTMAGTQLIRRPTLGPNPYGTSDPSLFLCSASTPPGAGVHGMAGYHAAEAALRAVLG